MTYGVMAQQGAAQERWFVISYWANTEGMAPSYHIDDRLPHLREAGIDVEMITSICGRRPPGWDGRWHRVPSLGASGYWFEMQHRVRRWRHPWSEIGKLLLVFPALPFYGVEKSTTRLTNTFWWWLPAGLAGLWWTRQRRPNLIYSTGGPGSEHLAAALIARVRGIPWVAEMQDPLVYQGLGHGRLANWLVRKVEQLIHARATGAIYLTRTACERARARSPGQAAVTAIYAGAEPPRAQVARSAGAPMRIVHAGTLSGTRNPRTLLAALRLLVERQPEMRREFHVTFMGATDAATREMVEAFAYPEMLTMLGKLPRAEAQARVEAAHLLLVIQNWDAVSAETIPSKTYEYLVSGQPILGLLYQNPELTSLLEEAGHRAVELNDVEAIVQEIESLHARWQRGTLQVPPCEEYTCAAAVRTLIDKAREWRGRAPDVRGASSQAPRAAAGRLEPEA